MRRLREAGILHDRLHGEQRHRAFERGSPERRQDRRGAHLVHRLHQPSRSSGRRPEERAGLLVRPGSPEVEGEILPRCQDADGDRRPQIRRPQPGARFNKKKLDLRFSFEMAQQSCLLYS